jgi:hypothetical protein
MKKLLILVLSLALTLFLAVLLIILVFEDQFVDAFKKRIIDKTSININFSEIRFSVFKNFPYGSFILDDAQIFYSKENCKDTLISSKRISFKINTLNLFRSIYEFPEIIITDGKINLYADKLDSLLSKEKSVNRTEAYRIETKRIKLIRCRVKYRYAEIVKLNLFLDHSFCSGSFLSDALELRLNLNIYSLTGSINNFPFKTNGLAKISITIKEKEDVYRSENGLIIFKSMPFSFAFVYTSKTDVLQLVSSAKKISAKDFCAAFLNTWNIGVSHGDLSFDSFYSINFNRLNTQKLSVKYEFENLAFTKQQDFSISTLKGTTNFTGHFDNNNSEISTFSLRYQGLDVAGRLKVKNILLPYVLVDCQFRNIKEINVGKGYAINGDFSGKLKSLIKVSDINLLDFNSLNVIKLSSEIKFSNLSIKNIGFINNLEGGIIIDDNSLQFEGKGLLLNTPFKGTLSIPNFLDVAFRKATPMSKISLNMERLNLDSIPLKTLKSDDTSTIIKYFINLNIKTLIYNGFTVKDLSLKLKNDNGKYQSDQFSLNAFKGRVNGNFISSQQEGSVISLSAQHLDIHDFFSGFNNFGQNTITNKNISGSLSGKLNLSFKRFANGNVNPLSVKLASNIEIENGRLIGVDQLKRVSSFLDLNEFDSIRFKTIRNNIEIENGLVRIPSMDVASNAVNFRLTGQHGFNGEFTYWIKLNLREILAKKYLSHNLNPFEYEVDNTNGLNLFLKIIGNNDSYKVSFDKKNTVEQVKHGFNQEGLLLKSIFREEFSKSKKDSFLLQNSLEPNRSIKFDSLHNKKQKKPFKIEWDEIDSTIQL